ncbi:MAG TPA: asparagine synthase-related protein [Solirubrobacteraceae bacterium]|nr:asparagine synthase-related protein [Solirubrobacteraceae bacterium]
MSAIVALVTREPAPEDHAWLTRATELSQSAGPEAQRHRQLGRCGLGHALLQTGHDILGPNTLDSQAWITADARLDARDALCATLRSTSPEISAASADAELLLAAYRRWGERLVEHVAGDFAFAIWDVAKQRLLCARDQIGVVPLHYARAGGSLLVATSLEPLVSHAAIGDDFDEHAIADFLAFGHYIDPSATAFAGVRQLPPAHVLTWANGEVRVRRYWQAPEWEPLVRFPRIEDGAECLRELLDVAVADRLTTSRASVQLSGGMDSTSVAASAIRALRARNAPAGALRAFTGVVGGSSGDREGNFAGLVADELAIPIDLVDASTRSSIDPFDTPLLRTPEPTIWQFTDYLLQFLLVPARHAPVALSGHGGDVLFLCLPWYWLEWLACGRAGRVVRAFAEQVRLCGGRPRPHAREILHLARHGQSLYPALPPWLLADFVTRTGVADRRRERMPRPFGMRARDLDARALTCDPMWAALFRLSDPAFTRGRVRFRHPLVDLRLIKFARSLAPEPWLANKRILREAARSRLPEAVRQRPKTMLVQAPTPGATEHARQRVADLATRSPELKRFVDTDLLAGEVMASGGDMAPARTRARERALGLAYWLWHQ